MRLNLFPATPNTRRVRELKDFCWDLDLTGSVLSLAFTGLAPMAEIRLGEPPERPVWQGDVLVFSDEGEFAIAVNRGMVISISAASLILPERRLDREERTVHLRDGERHFLIYFEWGDEPHWEPAGDGRVAVSCPGADWPLMLFIAEAPVKSLTDTEMERLKSVNMGEVVAITQGFGGAQPRLEMNPAIEELWEHAHHLHRVNTYEPEPPFIYEWEAATRTDDYASRVLGHWDTLHIVWDWLLVNASRARQEFENYLKSYDPDTAQMALDVAPMSEDVWPRGHRGDHEGRCMVCSHPPVWPELAWNLFLATDDRGWLSVSYEIARLNVGWWERERDRDHDGLYEYADTRYPQPWESGCDGSPRFDEIAGDGFACVDLNAQLVMFYRNLVRFAVELGERDAAVEFAQRQDRLSHLVRERLWDPKTKWFYDRRGEDFIRVRTTSGLWPLCAGVATPEQTEAVVEQLTDPETFGTWFPLPGVAANEDAFSKISGRGPARASEVFWIAMGLRHLGRTALAGRLVRRALDAMCEVLRLDGALYECYNPAGPDQSGLKLFDYHGEGDPIRRYYSGHAPVRAMVLSGLLGIEPTRDGLLVDPAEDALDNAVSVEFFIGENPYRLEAQKSKSGLKTTVRRGKTVVASAYGKLLVPRVELI